jgi:hypothetical protein
MIFSGYGFFPIPSFFPLPVRSICNIGIFERQQLGLHVPNLRKLPSTP